MMQPPGRIEQLNNFQDSIQSPDGLDRLRALQYIEQALPSSQGLSGMPQVTVPTPQMQPQVPMMNRAYGGEIGTGGLVGVAEDGTQIFDNSQEGALNRATHGGILEGFNYTPSTGGTATATPVTATPVTTNSLDAPGTLASGIAAPLSSTNDIISTPAKAPVKRYIGSGTYTYMPNDSGALGQVDIQDYKEPAYLPIAGFDKDISGQYNSYYEANQAAKEAGSPTFMYGNKLAKTDPGLLPGYQGDPKPFLSNKIPESLIDYANTLTMGRSVFNVPRTKSYYPTYLGSGVYADAPDVRKSNSGYGGYFASKHGGPVINRAYGGEIGTGGLVDILDDGTQVFNNSQEGALNRATYGGVLEGYNFTPSTGGTATAGVTTNSLDAPGTLASGVDYSSSSGVPGIASGALADLPSVQQRQGIYNASEFKDIGMSLDRPSDAPETILGYQAPQSTLRIPTRFDSSGNPIPGSEKIPQGAYVPKTIQTYGQGYDLGGLDYITANQLALNEGADRFMYGDKFARTDPGLLSNYNYYGEGAKPYMDADFMPKNQGDFASAGGNFTGKGMTTQSNIDNQLARAKGYKRDFSGRLVDKFGNPVQQKAGGGQVDPSQAAQGLASFGRYGDNILVHMNPEELEGLSSLGKITYNPVTGLPEAFNLGKMLRKIAPIALAIAAPYAFGATTALGIGASTALGSFAGNMIAGAKPGDALKAGLMSGLFAGGGAYLGGAASGFGGAASGGAGGAAGSTAGAGLSKAGGAMYGSTAGVAPSAGTSTLGAALSGPGLSGTGQAMYGSTPTFGPPVGSQFTPSMGDISSSLAQGRPPLQLANPNIGNPMVPRIGQNVNVGGQSFANASEFNPYQNALPEGADPRVMEMGAIDPPAPAGSEFTGSQYSNEGLPNAIAGPDGAGSVPSVGDPYGNQTVVRPDKVSIFKDQTPSNINRIFNEIKTDYANPTGIAKIAAMDLNTPDWEAQYAAEAAAKNQQLTDAGYTVDTGFDGQTVIRDSTGVVMPRNLTVQDILDRALGKQKRTNLVARTDYAPKESKQGGLISLKHGGEFSGMVPGDGHGMEDNVYMPIVEKGHGSQVGTLAVSPSEYVVDSYTMAALGNGNADAGAKVMDNVVKHVRKKAYGNTKQPNEISGLSALEPMIERV